MTVLLFQTDSYATEFDAKVVSVRPDGGIVLDQTLFYYTSGGQPCDIGEITRKNDGLKIQIKEVRKMDGAVVHIPSSPSSFAQNDFVHGKIDWTRRYKLMRTHTSGHVLSAILYAKGILITGNQLGIEHTRFDFNMENFDRFILETCIEEANRRCAEGHEIKVYFLPREEAQKLPGMVKLATALPPDIQILRIVEIEGIDTQADGGTHVKNTKEVGTIEFEKAENKGAANRRIYFTLKP